MTSEVSPLSNMIFAPGSEGIYYKVPSSQEKTLIVLYCVYIYNIWVFPKIMVPPNHPF